MRLFLAIVTSLSLTACQLSLTQKEKVKYRMPPPSLDCSIKRSLGSSFFKSGNWPKEQWWKMFHSPDLDCMIAHALSSNPSINEFRKRVEVAKQETVVVKSLLYPLVFFEAQDSKLWASHNGLYRALNPTFPISANLVDVSFSFTYDFDFWGKNRNLFMASIGKEMTQRAEFAQVELIAATALAQAYFALKTNLQRKKLYEQLLAVRVDIFELQKKMQSSALYSVLDPLLAQEEILEAKKLNSSINAEIEVDKHLINVLMGRSPDCPICINDQLNPLEKGIALPCNLSSDLLARRPDLMAQIWRAESLAYETGAAIADYYPDVDIVGFLGLESTTYKKLFQANSITGGFTPAIHLPIFTAGAIDANVKAKKAEFDAAIFAYNQLLLNSVQEVADILAESIKVFTQKREQDEIVSLARKRYEISLSNKKIGLDSRFDTYAKTEALILKELDNVTLLYDQYFVTIKLIKAFGGGFHTP